MSVEHRVKNRYAAVGRVAERFKEALDRPEQEQHYRIFKTLAHKLASYVQRRSGETVYSSAQLLRGFDRMLPGRPAIGEMTFDIEHDEGRGAQVRLVLADSSDRGSARIDQQTRYTVRVEYVDLNELRYDPTIGSEVVSPKVAGPDERMMLEVCLDALKDCLDRVM